MLGKEKNYIIAGDYGGRRVVILFFKFMTFDLDGSVCGRTLCEKFRKLRRMCVYLVVGFEQIFGMHTKGRCRYVDVFGLCVA